ncbi:MAG: hypothetical protein ABSG91_14455 [Syntrophobacteraceae bacterium]|jgi:hypothetical protein
MRSDRFQYAFTLTTMFAASMLVSCAARPVRLSPEHIAPSVLLPAAQGGIIDGRGRFREIFKDALRALRSKDAAQAPWEDHATLWKLPGESPATGKPTPCGPSGGSFRVVIVPGLLAECVAQKSTAFGDARARLEEIGYKTDYIQTRGRKGSAVNAALVRDAVTAMPAGERLIFVTHSKGTVDTLEAMVKYPALAERTAAVVSVSGAVNGSPLADVFPKFLTKLVHRFPLSSCPAGEDSEAVESLRRNVRISWLSTHQLPKSVRYYSLAAFTTRENTSRILRPFYDILATTEPVNDGMVICSDAIVPGSVLLGYPNADHFAVAMPFSRQTSPLLAALIDKNDYPRAALLEAAVRFVEEDLAQTGSPALPQ